MTSHEFSLLQLLAKLYYQSGESVTAALGSYWHKKGVKDLMRTSFSENRVLNHHCRNAWHPRVSDLKSDEAHFWLNGYVNKQNCRIWSEANPQVYVETPLHPEKLTVWCALWAGGIIVPYFFKNDEGHNVTVNGDRLISRFGPVNWPPRFCDLTPLDYFLWGYVKSLVYANKPQTLDHLEDNIRGVIADIRPQMLEKAIENWTSRLDYIRTSRGSHMPEIIFKM
ncbi:transposase [Trichonephila clavipes]|nr:transposase [Trichonephila clavipes]